MNPDATSPAPVVSRRSVLRGGAALGAAVGAHGLVGLSAAGAQTPPPPPPTTSTGAVGVFQDPTFQFDLENILGATWSQGADVGECLATAATITDGDAEGWYQAWTATAQRVAAAAEASEARGDLVSAYGGWRRAATYSAFAIGSLDGTDDPSRFVPGWEAHRALWERAVDRCPTPVERVTVPYEGTTLPGYLFRAAPGSCADAGGQPLLVLVNGSDGATADMWSKYGVDAVARGYHVVLVDGPGQQAALFRQGLVFRPDWEAVVTPTIDWALPHLGDEVDPRRIVLLGCSQGGYWAPRAAAFEPRVAALVADPGVVDVSTSWFRNLPPELLQLFEAGDQATFDAYIEEGLSESPEDKAEYDFRARPYGISSPFELYSAVASYNLTGVAGRITCPTFIASPEGEQFWPGQSEQLAEAVSGPAHVAVFTAAEGAALHCEPMACAVRNQRIFDWLDEVLGR